MRGSCGPVLIYIDLYKIGKQPFLLKYVSVPKILYARFVLLVSRARQLDMNIKSVNSVNSTGHWLFSVLVTRIYVNICILPLKWKSYFWIEGGLHKYGIYRVRFYATELALIYRITREWEKLLREKLESTFQRRWQWATTRVDRGRSAPYILYIVQSNLKK